MGERTSVNQPTKSAARVPSAAPARSLRLGFDVPLLLIVATLVVFGLIMVFSTTLDVSRFVSDGSSNTVVFFRQLRWVLLGGVLAFVLTFIDYHRYKPWLIIGLVGTLVALGLVLFFGESRFNATRTITAGSIQPGEFAKLMTIIYLSFWLSNRGEQINDWSMGLLPLGAILGSLAGLILAQPDLSTAITIILLGGILFFMAGGAWRQIAMVLTIAALAVAIIITVFSTGQARWAAFLAGIQDPFNASYQVQRGMEAVARGGWFGVGLGNSVTKYVSLPVPHTDGIYAVVVEELGLVGALVIMALYLGLLWRGLTIARRAPDQLGSLLAGGVAIWLTMEAMINMTVLVGLLPVSGNALPFISVGGSNMLVSLAGVGLMMNVARRAAVQEEVEGRSFSAVVDLRRRDGRRRVSRSYGPANPAEQQQSAAPTRRTRRSTGLTREYASSLDLELGRLQSSRTDLELGRLQSSRTDSVDDASQYDVSDWRRKYQELDLE